jgi:Co/Zn/Cd efflux system component
VSGHAHDGGHSHGLISASIKRSRAGLRAVSWSLVVLLVTSAAQAAVFALTGSVALLADLIHNFGDALTAVPLGVAFVMRSFVAEKRAGYFVVATIFVSACVALVESINRLINPHSISHLGALAAAGVIGFVGNEIARGFGCVPGSGCRARRWSPMVITLAPTGWSACRLSSARRWPRSGCRSPTRSSV